MASLYDTPTLVAVVNDPNLAAEGEYLFLTNKFFSKTTPVYSETAEIQEYTGGSGMATVVRRGTEAQVVATNAGASATVRLPVTREKKYLTDKILREGAAAPIGGATAANINAAKGAAIARNALDLQNRMRRHIEYMAGKLFTAGAITFEDERYKGTIDYGVPDGHRPTGLSGSNAWTHADSNPGTNLTAWSNLLQTAYGTAGATLILGTTAAAAFANNAKVMSQLNNLNYGAGRLDLKVGDPFIGRYQNIDVFTYARQFTYTDVNGVQQTVDVFPANGALLIAGGFQGQQLFGVVDEVDADGSQQFFAKSWEEQDPAGRWLLASTATLPVPGSSKGFIYTTVTA